MRILIAAWVFVAAAAVPAFGQEPAIDQANPPQGGTTQKPPAAVKPKTPKLPVGLRAFFTVESTAMSASSTFDAVTGTSAFTGFGGGAEVLNLVKKMFVRAGVSTTSQSGSRAFLIDGTVVPTGVPIDIGITTAELSVGWRSYMDRRQRAAWYAGTGGVFTRFSEESAFPQPGDNETNTFKGYAVFAGFDAAIWKSVIAGVEGQYRSVADALGDGGLSQAYGETNLGGFAIRGMVGIRLRK